MRTQLLGQLDVDVARLEADLLTSPTLPMVEPYSEYSCGRPWKSCMLWTPGGTPGNGVLKHYDTSRPGQPTEAGRRLPYVCELIERSVATEHLLFARMAVVVDNVLLPHRDYVEFPDEQPNRERASLRMHIPLATNDDCLFIEDDVVFRMRRGELWTLDVSRLHSAAVLSETPRIHVILDFGGSDSPGSLVRQDRLAVPAPLAGPGIPDSHCVARPPLSEREREAVLKLSEIARVDNLYQVLGIVIKRVARRGFGNRGVWETMEDIARLSGDPALQSEVSDLYTYCALTRPQ